MKKTVTLISGFSFINIRVIAVFLVIVLLAIGANAQSRQLNDGSTPLGIAPGSPAGSSSLSNLDTINPYNGNLNFRLPLINVGGRGNSGYTATLPINYRWSVLHHYEQAETFRHYPTTYRPLHAIRPNYRAGKFEVRNVEENWCNQSGGGSLSTLTMIIFTAADGTEYEFRDELLNGSPAGANCISGVGASRGTVWKTSDGSFLTFISDTVISDLSYTSANNLFGHMMFPDGTKYRIEAGKVSWIRDRNGNVTTFTYSGTYSDAPLVKVTDSIGREITFAYDVQDSGQYGLHDQITYKGFGGQPRTIRISYKSLSEVLRSDQTIQTYQALFGELDSVGISPPHNPTDQIAAVWLPNGQAYRFYYNSYSELARVELPTGGAFEYDWGKSISSGYSSGVVYVSGTQGLFPEIYRQVLTKRIYPEGGTGSTFALKTTFSQTQGQGTTTSSKTIEQRDASNNLLGQTKHYFHGSPIPYYGTNIYFKPAWDEGREYQTEIFDIVSGTPVLKRHVNQTWQKGAGTGYNEGNARVIETVTTLVDTNQVAKSTAINPIDSSIGFDQFNNQTDVWEYDYGAGAAGAFKRRTHTVYETDTNYTSYTGSHLRSLPLETWVSSDTAGSNKAALTQFEYDNYTSGGNYAALVSRSSVFGHDTANYGTSYTRRGNLTKVTTYGNAQSQTASVSVYSQYDILGNIVKTIDAKGYISTMDYSDRFGSPDSEARSNTAPTQLNGQSTFAVASSATNPLGWTIYSQFDYFTGQAVNIEDINGVISKTFYNDLLDRPTQSVTAVGLTNYERQTTIFYDDDITDRRVEIKSDLNTLNDNLLKTESFYDGLGRTIESRWYESDNNFIATKTVPFEMVQDPETSAWRAATKVSNRYRPNAGEQLVWIKSLNDSLGRVVKVITPDGAVIKTEYSGNAVTVTDQALKQRRSITNALGQLKEVHEPNNAGQLGTITSPNQPTFYNYDTLGNLVEVQQNGVNTEQCGGTTTNCTQTRTFQYDSLSRLKEVTNPESGIISYTYDANGNLQTKREARGIKTVYDYDNLNRNVKKCYRNIGTSAPLGMTTCVNNNETPEVNTTDVTYTYENVAITSLKGVLTKVANGVSTTEYTGFDQLGRIIESRQTTDNRVLDPMTYKYNLSGALVEQKYPSGRMVRNVLDNDGDLSIVQSKKNANQGFFNYADSFTYTAAGGVSSMQFGNGTWESAIFNSRLQPEQIALGTVKNGTDKLKLNYTYNTSGQNDNNSNVLSQTITVPTETRGSTTYNAFTATQTYTYDSLNRLKDAKEMIGTTQQWKQTFKYDRYGNRRFNTDNNNTTTLGANCPTAVCNPEIDVTKNRLVGTSYDNAGNTTVDAENKTFTYDAENKQTKVVSNGQTIGEYFYDGDGKRVKKQVGTETTIFIYDASGKLVAEYSTTVEPVSTAKVSYLTNDHLGSPRINTDANGKVEARHDYLPFGEEISRASYGGDAVRKQFTGYERDGESELDFAQARYYTNQLGRFTTVDPLFFQAMMLVDPQRFNLYNYARNNPYKWIDPSGEKLYLRGDRNWLLNNILYQMAGGQSEFDKFFQIADGQVVVREGVDTSNVSAGVGLILQMVNSSENFLYFAGTNGEAAADLFKGSRNEEGELTKVGKENRDKFNGTDNTKGDDGTLIGTTGRAGQPDTQPANLDNGNTAIFFVLAINTNIEQTQTGTSSTYRDISSGAIIEFSTQLSGRGFLIKPVSIFIHESSENLVFATMTAAERSSLWGYPVAHSSAMHREAQIRKDLKITGGFAGGVVRSIVPKPKK